MFWIWVRILDIFEIDINSSDDLGDELDLFLEIDNENSEDVFYIVFFKVLGFVYFVEC